MNRVRLNNSVAGSLDFARTSMGVVHVGCLTAAVEVEACLRFPFLLLYWLPHRELYLVKVEGFRQEVAAMPLHRLGHAEVLVQFVVFHGKLLVLGFLHWAHKVALDCSFFVPPSAIGES